MRAGVLSGVSSYIEKVKRECHARGFVQTLLGRKRLLPGIASRNPTVRRQAERQAINTVCQVRSSCVLARALIMPLAGWNHSRHMSSNVAVTRAGFRC